MTRSNRRWSALTTLLLTVVLAACAGSAASSTPPGPLATIAPTSAAAAATITPAPVTSPAATSAAPACPTAGIVGAALGIALGDPTSVPAAVGGTPLPAGASGVACDYHAATANVLVELIANIDPSIISRFSDKFPVPFAPVSGMGDQARSFSQSLGGGKTNEGVVATKGSSLVFVVATATPASLTQVEGLVSQLL